jgi:hypothetical protein
VRGYHIVLGGALFATTSASLGLTAPVGAPGTARRVKEPIVLSSLAAAGVPLGSRETSARTRLEAVFGRPTRISKSSGTEAEGCGFNLSISWPHFEAVFFRGSFVGYNTGYSTRPLSEFKTEPGLRVGDTVAQAERIYGHAFQTYAAQGGSWSVQTEGLYGYLVSPPRVGPSDRIAGIAAGHVGCPAMTP